MFWKIGGNRKFVIQGWNEASIFAGTMGKCQVRFPIVPWTETLQIHHCQFQGEGALDAVDLHVLSLLFLFCELHCLMIHRSLSFTRDLNLNFFCLGACWHSQVLLNLLFWETPDKDVCSTFGINLPAGSKVYWDHVLACREHGHKILTSEGAGWKLKK